MMQIRHDDDTQAVGIPIASGSCRLDQHVYVMKYGLLHNGIPTTVNW